MTNPTHICLLSRRTVLTRSVIPRAHALSSRRQPTQNGDDVSALVREEPRARKPPPHAHPACRCSRHGGKASVAWQRALAARPDRSSEPCSQLEAPPRQPARQTVVAPLRRRLGSLVRETPTPVRRRCVSRRTELQQCAATHRHAWLLQRALYEVEERCNLGIGQRGAAADRDLLRGAAVPVVGVHPRLAHRQVPMSLDERLDIGAVARPAPQAEQRPRCVAIRPALSCAASILKQHAQPLQKQLNRARRAPCWVQRAHTAAAEPRCVVRDDKALRKRHRNMAQRHLTVQSQHDAARSARMLMDLPRARHSHSACTSNAGRAASRSRRSPATEHASQHCVTRTAMICAQAASRTPRTRIRKRRQSITCASAQESRLICTAGHNGAISGAGEAAQSHRGAWSTMNWLTSMARRYTAFLFLESSRETWWTVTIAPRPTPASTPGSVSTGMVALTAAC